MKKVIAIALMLTLSLSALAGCGSGPAAQATDPGTEPTPSAEVATPTPTEAGGEETQAPEETLPPEETESPEAPTIASMLEGLEKNAYESLVFTAEAAGEPAAPGAAIPITVTVKNEGEETVVYVQGSGSHTTPDALLLEAEGLQAVKAKDKLGIATMDYVVKELKPGEELTFTLYVMAIEQHEQFDTYSYELNGEDKYIAEMSFAELQEKYPELTAAAPGEYSGSVYFRYFTKAAGEDSLFGEANSYAQAEFAITVAEPAAE